MSFKVKKFVIEKWLAVSSSWQLTSHTLYYKIPYFKAFKMKKQGIKCFLK
jgi:hypothetical protein